jgi:predicted MFS family arabinose efflux permease
MADGDGGQSRRGQGFASVFLPSEWLLLLVLAAVHFTNIIDFMIVMPLGPKYLRYFAITPQQFGVVVSAYGIAASVSGFLAAWFMDRFDRKKSLLVLFAGFTVSTFACAFAPTYWLLVLARTVTGAFGGVLGAGVLAIVGDAFPEERRGTAMGVVMSAFSVASILGVPAGLMLADGLGWRAPFIVLGLFALGLFPLAWLWLPSLRGHLGRHPVGTPRSLLAVLTHPAHLRAYGLMLALVLTGFTVAPYMATFLVSNVGMDERDLRYVYLLGGLTTLVTLTWVGRLADRLGKLPVFRILALLSGATLILVTHLPPLPLLVVLAATTLLMIVTSGRMVPAMAMITASTAPHYRGSFMSVISSVQHLASGLSGLLAGLLLGETADGKMTGFGTVGILAAVASVASVAWAGQLRPGEEEAAAPAEEGIAHAASVRLPYSPGSRAASIAIPAPSGEGGE